MLTNKEKEVIELSRRLSNSIMELPEQLPSDREDVLSKIRDIQSIVMARESVRNNPDIFVIGEYGGKTSDFDKKRVQDVPVNDYKEDKRIRTDFPYGHA